MTSPPPDSPTASFLSARPAPAAPETGDVLHIDACGTRCPVPLLRLRKALGRSAPGQVIVLTTDDPAAVSDIPQAMASLRGQLFAARREGDRAVFTVLRQ